MENFQKKLINLIEKNGINQRKLSKALGKEPSLINSWYLGKKTPTPENLKLLAEYFNVPIAYFFENDIVIQELQQLKNSGQVDNSDPRGLISTINVGLKMGKKQYYYYKVSETDNTVHFDKDVIVTIDVFTEIQNNDLVMVKVKGREHEIRRVMFAGNQTVLINDEAEIIENDNIDCMYLIYAYETLTRKAK